MPALTLQRRTRFGGQIAVLKADTSVQGDDTIRGKLAARFLFVTNPDFVPAATYRFQFHRGFPFARATELLDYLRELGISDVYSSPFFQSGAASTHGYDVADHNRINPELGGEEAYERFVSALHARGMGHLLDFVPNHMGISEPINRWWMDVLENGPMSLYEGYFDIEWHPLKQELENKVLLPILGERYGRVLESGDFRLSMEGGGFFLRYHQTKLPLNPRTYPVILELAAAKLGTEWGQEVLDELLSVSSALGGLPDRAPGSHEKTALRAREKEVCKRRLSRLIADAPVVASAVAQTLKELEGRVGDPASFDALHQLLSSQVYRLAYWRVAAEEINYRRFFDVNTLAAIRTEIAEVFEASHERVFRMIEKGEITGLRIDHIDGLWNPQVYLERLRERCPAQPIYLLVEKILARDERLPSHWPVDGTTGYEFASELTGLLVDPASEQQFTQFYASFAEDTRLEDLVYEKKLLITRMAMASEVVALGGMLNRLSENNRHYRDFTLNQLTAAVRETIACFPVYRTYVSRGDSVSDEDRLIVLRSVRKARSRNPSIDKPIFDFLAKMLLLEIPSGTTPQEWDEQIRFALKFQQCTGPVMAKGLEDTTFYIYNRLVALNEVGGEPGRFGMSLEHFHARCVERHERFPHTLLATSTHDTKRSEDVRARLAALSEFPDEWRKVVTKAVVANAGHKAEIDGHHAPSPNEEYLLYQTLAGAWPLQSLSDETRPAFVQRIQEYMVKALKEAKINSSWIEPNEEWEKATQQFVASILDPVKGKKFLQSFVPFVERLAPVGIANSLAQLVLKCTTPGVPDFYQGCEVWDFSLVDPDNRRPVDYAVRSQLLASLPGREPSELLADWRSGAVKLFVMQKLLRLRAEFPLLFRSGTHEPMGVRGSHADRVVAFMRAHEGVRTAVIVPRHTAPLGFPATGRVWKHTSVELPAGRWRDGFTGREVVSTGTGHPLADLLTHFSVACLVSSPA